VQLSPTRRQVDKSTDRPETDPNVSPKKSRIDAGIRPTLTKPWFTNVVERSLPSIAPSRD